MPRSVDPDRWERYVRLRLAGWYPAEAAKRAGVAKATALDFEAAKPTSSGMRWLTGEMERFGITLTGGTTLQRAMELVVTGLDASRSTRVADVGGDAAVEER